MGSFSAPIEIRGLTKTFKAARAVNDLSFDVQAGSITGFLGPNGSGKTTTLRMLLGLVSPTSGSATINGTPMRLLPTRLGPSAQYSTSAVSIRNERRSDTSRSTRPLSACRLSARRRCWTWSV